MKTTDLSQVIDKLYPDSYKVQISTNYAKKIILKILFSYITTGIDINVCPIVLRLSDGTSEKIRFPNVPVRQTNLFPLV